MLLWWKQQSIFLSVFTTEVRHTSDKRSLIVYYHSENPHSLTEARQ